MGRAGHVKPTHLSRHESDLERLPHPRKNRETVYVTFESIHLNLAKAKLELIFFSVCSHFFLQRCAVGTRIPHAVKCTLQSFSHLDRVATIKRNWTLVEVVFFLLLFSSLPSLFPRVEHKVMEEEGPPPLYSSPLPAGSPHHRH